MDESDGRPGHVAFQSGHLNASTGAPAPSLPLFPDDPNKTTPAKWFAGRVLILPPVHGVALPRGAHLAQCLPGFGVSGSMGRDFDRFYFQRENPRLCRGGSRSSRLTEVIHGLSFYLLLAEFFERRGAWAPSLRDSGQTVGFAHPALKRGASKQCAYGACAKPGGGNELPLARRWRWQCASLGKRIDQAPLRSQPS